MNYLFHKKQALFLFLLSYCIVRKANYYPLDVLMALKTTVWSEDSHVKIY